MAGLLNAASNALNQVYNIEVDRINKPDRPDWIGPHLPVVSRFALLGSMNQDQTQDRSTACLFDCVKGVHACWVV